MPPSRPLLGAEPLESRIAPVLGAFAPAPIVEPGTGFDGVVEVGLGSGSLLYTGRHVLTAAHVVADDAGRVEGPVAVAFDLPNAPGRIIMVVPAGNIAVHPDYGRISGEGDIAVLTLPALAPSGPPGLGADRYDLYRTFDELGRVITIVGYGNTGTGLTGDLRGTAGEKRFARNIYEVTGDRFGIGRSLVFDFDSGSRAEDALGRLFGINQTGIAGEGTSGRGDSGGPVFITAGGRNLIAGTTTSGLTPRNPPNPAVRDPSVDFGFGTLSRDTRVSAYAPWIDSRLAGRHRLVFDLRNQVVGLDAVPDTVTVRAAGGNLELLVNNSLHHSVPVGDVISLTIVGAGETGTPFATSVVVEGSVPAALPVGYLRVAVAVDQRTGTTTFPTADAPPQPSAPPTGAGERPVLSVPLGAFPNLVAPPRLVAVGPDAGAGPRVTVFDAETGEVVRNFFAFDPAFLGGVRVAVGDVNGDLIDDVIVAAGPGGGPHVRVFDGATGELIAEWFAYAGEFTGGVFVAAGDVTGDGFAEVITGAGPGGGPHVRVFNGRTGAEVRGFFAYEDSQRGGATVAAADVDNDGYADVITGAGVGGGPRVRVFSGANGLPMLDFFAYDPSFRNGVFVAAGDVDGDGRADLVTGAGVGGGPHVRTFDGATGEVRLSFFPYSRQFTGGVRVAVADADGDGLADVVVGPGAGGERRLRAFDGRTGEELTEIFPFEAGFTGGVFVGGRG
jgi:hypothetical protein